MSTDSSRQLAYTAPRNAELHAVALADRTAQEAAKKKAEAFDAMHYQLHMVLPYLEQLRDDEARSSRPTYKPGVLDALVRETFEAITKAEACK